MTENTNKHDEKDVKIYDTSDIIFEGKPKRARTAQRDIKPHDNEKTRVYFEETFRLFREAREQVYGE